MNDHIDSYISRSVKNWAAQYRPPSDGFKRLKQTLLIPASMPTQKSLPSMIESLRNRYFSPVQISSYHEWRNERNYPAQDWYLLVSNTLRLSRLAN
jgi:hypothetical protein